MNFVKATEKDFETLRDFYYDVIDNTPDIDKHAQWKKDIHPSAETLRKYLSQGAMYMLAEDDDIYSVMALCAFQSEEYKTVPWTVNARENEVATIHILAVSPAHQGFGISEEMLYAAISSARKAGKKALRLDTLKTNTPAQAIYSSMGFKYVGSQNLYAENTGWTDFLYYEYKL